VPTQVNLDELLDFGSSNNAAVQNLNFNSMNGIGGLNFG